MTDLNFKTEVNYSDLKNTKFFEVKAYSLDDESKYITLKVQNVTDKFDDKGNYIGDEFTVRFVEIGLLTNFFISSQQPIIIVIYSNQIWWILHISLKRGIVIINQIIYY